MAVWLCGCVTLLPSAPVMENVCSMHDVMCIRRRVRACKRLSEAAKTLTTRDHVSWWGVVV
jgi:hypothetical protein